MQPTSPDDTAERRTRQLAYTEELQALSMRLARIAAARAEAVLEAEPEPDTSPAAPAHAALAFSRLARCVRDMIHLENRIVDGARARNRFAAPGRHDSRKTILRDILHTAVRGEPDANRRRQDIDERLDAELAADPDFRVPTSAIINDLADHFGIRLVLADMPDEVLDMPPRPLRRANL